MDPAVGTVFDLWSREPSIPAAVEEPPSRMSARCRPSTTAITASHVAAAAAAAGLTRVLTMDRAWWLPSV